MKSILLPVSTSLIGTSQKEWYVISAAVPQESLPHPWKERTCTGD